MRIEVTSFESANVTLKNDKLHVEHSVFTWLSIRSHEQDLLSRATGCQRTILFVGGLSLCFIALHYLMDYPCTSKEEERDTQQKSESHSEPCRADKSILPFQRNCHHNIQGQ